MNPGDRGLWQDRSFWGHISTQFLGAFNDNLFKQLILLLAISEVAGKNLPANGQQEVDIQSLAMVISLARNEQREIFNWKPNTTIKQHRNGTDTVIQTSM